MLLLRCQLLNFQKEEYRNLYDLLIVEDEALERKALNIILKRSLDMVSVVGEAKNGKEAVELSKRLKPDIILMDIEMPELNGLDAQKEIKTFLPYSKTIILTAYDSFDFARNAIRLGVFDYILKPVQPNVLVKVITEAVSNLLVNQNTINENGNINESLIKEALNFIKGNFNQNINLESVASYVHLNPQYFSRYFKNKTGTNFIEYLSMLRINKAKDMLIKTDKSITEICLSVGYVDSSYFSKVFIKHVGITPIKFRYSNK